MTELLHNEFINWAFPEGLGVVLLGVVGWAIKIIYEKRKPDDKSSNYNDGRFFQTINVTPHNYTDTDTDTDMEKNLMQDKDRKPIEVRRDITNILFIDDKKFDVVDILKNSGWKNTVWIKDIKSLNQKEIINANIIFVDIQGVGIQMRFSEEGLGLAKAIKEKYKEKKIVIYSAEQTGNRFHEALRMVDDSLDKDSDPYVFEDIVDRLS
ncbi:response regulator [Yersinia enterocolitica]|nr:response regulator [Yersinia enterocolitica]